MARPFRDTTPDLCVGRTREPGEIPHALDRCGPTSARWLRAGRRALGRHLGNPVRTGAWCVHAPERPLRWVS